MEKTLKIKRRRQLSVIIIVIVALVGVLTINTDRATAVRADETATEAVAPAGNAVTPASEEGTGFYSSAMPSLFKLISALIVVVVCIYVGVFLLKRLMGKKYSGNSSNSVLEVLETTYVAPKKSVSLLRVADKAVLVGMSDNQISVLTELTADETARVLDNIEPQQSPESFTKALGTAMGKIKEIRLKRAGKTALET